MPAAPESAAPAPAAPVFAAPEQTLAGRPGQISLVWSLAAGAGRDLDASVVRLAPGADLGEPTATACGTLLTVLAGDGELRLPDAVLALAPGALAWLPAHTPHTLRAGERGLTWTTAHRRPGATGPDRAGEPVCLLERVCPHCGRLATDRDARYCARCATALTGPG
ncbi:hypothetical protein ABZ953_36955 [Streptomyces sp. NPDC046465]|uniref:hypothetical protein n=1 Tax=Streptomyces sp. NPDC046465 TaxID=3155810 RepID=UPI0034075D06